MVVYFHPVQTNRFFFTATILKWQHLLASIAFKDILIDSLRFLSANKRVRVLAFVIMPNHVHLLWDILEPHTKDAVQRDFLKYTSQQILYRLKAGPADVLGIFLVNAKDRRYQLWQRGALSLPLYNDAATEQKIRYIHLNPVVKRWNLASTPEDYSYSSASYYLKEDRTFGFIDDWRE